MGFFDTFYFKQIPIMRNYGIYSGKLNGFAFLLIFAVAMATFSACTKDEAISKNESKVQFKSTVFRGDYETMEEYLKARNAEIEEAGVTYTVQHATLDEVNAVMIEHGLEPFTQEDITRANKRGGGCGPYTCNTWINHGDWSGDFTLSTLDLVQAQNYVCTWVGTCPYYGGSIPDIITEYFNGNVIGEAVNFAQLSFFWCEGGDDVLDYDDVLAGRDYILLKITCT